MPLRDVGEGPLVRLRIRDGQPDPRAETLLSLCPGVVVTIREPCPDAIPLGVQEVLELPRDQRHSREVIVVARLETTTKDAASVNNLTWNC